MNKLIGLVQVLCGIGLYIFGVTIGLSWLAFCFGTVIVGILLLIFAPYVLLLPFTFGFVPGNAFIISGINRMNNANAMNNNLDGL